MAETVRPGLSAGGTPSLEPRSAPRAVSKEELDARLKVARSEMAAIDAKVAIFTTPENIYYLSGYQTRAITSSQALIVSVDGDVILMTRRIDEGNYLRLQDRSPITRLVTFTDDKLADAVTMIGETARDRLRGGRVIGVEKDGAFMAPRQYEALLASLGDAKAVDVGGSIDRLRRIKSPLELEYHRAAAGSTMAAMSRAIEVTRNGALDSDIAAEVASALIRSGSEWIATWPIILTGAQTGRSHSSWQRDEVRAGEPTNLEFAAAVQRYHTPLYRTVINAPTREQIRLAEAVSKAHHAGVAAMRPGAVAQDIYFVEQAVLEEHGVADLLAARVGYSVGIAFAPNWTQRNGVDLIHGNRTELRPGMVFHMVTMLMRANVFGIAHSSSVAMTETGREILTNDGVDGPILR